MDNEKRLTKGELKNYKEISILGDFNEETMSEMLDELDDEDSVEDFLSLMNNNDYDFSKIDLENQNLSKKQLTSLLSDLLVDYKKLTEICDKSQKTMGFLVNEKKKATLIAKKYRKKASSNEAKYKESVATLQNFQEHQERYENEQLQTLRLKLLLL